MKKHYKSPIFELTEYAYNENIATANISATGNDVYTGFDNNGEDDDWEG